MLFEMRNILNKYITPKNNSVSDIYMNYFACGLYEIKENNEYYYLRIETEEDFFDVIENINSICKEMKSCTNNYYSPVDEKLKMEIWIENPSNWSMPVYPLENKICLGVNNNIPIDEAMKYCKNFEEIHIGGYRGNKVSVPNNFNSNYFNGFEDLRILQINDFETAEDKARAKKLSEDLEEALLIIE